MILIFNNILSYLQSRRLAFWVICSAAFALLLIVIYFLTNYSIATITIKQNDGISGQASVYSIAKNREDKKLAPIFNDLYLINRDTIAIRAANGNYSTIKETPNVTTQSAVKINLFKDKNAVKYSGSNLGCMTYDGTNDKLQSYSCTRPRELVEYRQPSSSAPPRNISTATIATTDALVYSVKPFDGGVAGIRMPRFQANVPTSNFLFSINSSGQTIEARVPDSLSQEQLGSTSIVTDTTSASQTNFLLIAKQTGKIYFSSKIDKTSMAYKEYTLPENFSSVFDTLLCTLLQSKAYCFYGSGSGAPDSKAETKHHEEKKPATFVVIDFSGNTPTASQYKTRLPLPIDSLYISQQGNLYTLSGEDIVRINFSDTIATPYTYITNVGSITAGDGLYFVRDNSVYKQDDETNESYLVFHSDRLRLSNVVSINEYLFINAYTTDDIGGQKIHTYKITDQPNETPGARLIDLLPLDLNASSDISDMDLYKDKLFIRVKVTVKKTGARGGIDTNEYTAAKERILTTLRERLGNIDTLPVIFYY